MPPPGGGGGGPRGMLLIPLGASVSSSVKGMNDPTLQGWGGHSGSRVSGGAGVPYTLSLGGLLPPALMTPPGGPTAGGWAGAGFLEQL